MRRIREDKKSRSFNVVNENSTTKRPELTKLLPYDETEKATNLEKKLMKAEKGE